MDDKPVTERIVEQPTVTVVERKGNGGIILAILFVGLAVAGGYFLVVEKSNDTRQTDAVVDAAKSIGGAAESVGETADTVGEATRDTVEDQKK
ncbi:MAG: hypothetical protein JJE34_00745 [Alphaproteobacteria bacterium]|nr:hypothetical protein [Alphaproteobacteria bacterium]